MTTPQTTGIDRGRTLSRLVAAAARVIARWIPAVAVDPEGPDVVAETVQAVCMSAAGRRGRVAGALAGALELATLMRLVGRRGAPRLTMPVRPPEPRRRSAALQLSLRLAWRRLLGARANATWAIVTLALGIGLGTTVFSVLDSILWRPAPYPDADRLVEMATYNADRKFLIAGFYSPRLLAAWRTQTDLFERIEGFDTPTVPYAGDDGSETVEAAIVTPGLMPLLGAAPERGRLFGPGEGRTGASEAILVSDAFWRSRLRGDPGVIGRPLVVDDAPRRVVGVLPASFRFPNGRTEVWIPFDVDAPPASGSSRTLTPVARLAPGRTMAAASLEARTRGSRLSAAAGDPPSQTAELYPLSGTVDDRTQRSLWLLAGAVGFLFLVVSANVANLALSRSLSRARDLAVHTALGATTADLVREAFIENALIALVGCLAGSGLAVGLTHLARVSLPEAMTTVAFNPIAVNGRAVIAAAALGAASAIVFGLPVALLASRSPLGAVFGAPSRSATGSRGARRLRGLLVVAEVAMSTALLVGAAVMTRSFVAAATASRGFDTANLISVRVGLPTVGYRDPAVRLQFAADAIARLRQTPGIVAATDGGLPTDARPIMMSAVTFADRPNQPVRVIVPQHEVRPDYFSALGIPLMAGRLFGPSDDANAVIVSDAFARKYWPGRSAIGARFRGEGQDWQTVIGVVGTIRPMTGGILQTGSDLYYQIGKAPEGYRPMFSAASSIAAYETFVIRAERNDDAISIAPRVIHTIDPHVVIWRTALVDHLYDDAIARPRTVFLLMAIFAGVGLVLAMAGMYGVLSHLVSQRLREIGVRFALGARPADVGRLVLGSGLTLAAIGLLLGLALASALSHVATTVLTDVGRPDALSVAVVVLVLGATAVFASWSPAERAMRVDPVTLLRDE